MGYMVAGYGIQRLGTIPLLMAGATFTLSALYVLNQVQRIKRYSQEKHQWRTSRATGGARLPSLD